MLHKIKRYFTPPVFVSEEDKNRVQTLLSLLLKYFFFFCIILVIGTVYLFEKKLASFLIISILFLSLLTSKILGKRGFLLLAGLVPILTQWVSITLIIWFSGGINSIAAMLYFLITILAGTLLGRWGAVLFAFLSALAGLVMALVQSSGVVAPIYFTMPIPARLFVWCVSLSAITIMINYALNYLSRSLNEARKEIEERKKIEGELNAKSKKAFEAAEKYRSYIEVSHSVAWEYLTDTGAVIFGPEFFLMLGYTSSDIDFSLPESSKQILRSSIHPDDLNGIQNTLRRHLAENSQGIFEAFFRIKSNNGSWLWILARGRLLLDAQGEPTHKMIGSLTDITNQKENEQKIIEQSLLIKRINEQSPDIIYIYDLKKDANIYINKDIASYLGYRKDELPEDSIAVIRRLIHPDDVNQFDNYVEKAQHFRDEYILEFEYRLLAKDSTWRWFTGNEKVFEADEHEVRTLIGTVREVTEKKQVEKELLIYKHALETSQDAMFLVSRDGSFSALNPAASKIYGYSPQEFHELQIYDMDPSYSNVTWARHWDELRQKKSLNFESRHRAKGGKMIPVEISLSFIILDETEYNIAFIHDISIRKAAEQTLRESEEKFALAFKTSAVSVSITTLKDGRYILVNDEFCRISGYSSEEIIGERVVNYQYGPILCSVMSLLIRCRLPGQSGMPSFGSEQKAVESGPVCSLPNSLYSVINSASLSLFKTSRTESLWSKS